jgi:hypothetical protein
MTDLQSGATALEQVHTIPSAYLPRSQSSQRWRLRDQSGCAIVGVRRQVMAPLGIRFGRLAGRQYDVGRTTATGAACSSTGIFLIGLLVMVPAGLAGSSNGEFAARLGVAQSYRSLSSLDKGPNHCDLPDLFLQVKVADHSFLTANEESLSVSVLAQFCRLGTFCAAGPPLRPGTLMIGP